MTNEQAFCLLRHGLPIENRIPQNQQTKVKKLIQPWGGERRILTLPGELFSLFRGWYRYYSCSEFFVAAINSFAARFFALELLVHLRRARYFAAGWFVAPPVSLR